MATSSSTSTRIGSSKTTEAEALSLFCLWWLGGRGGARAQQCMSAAAAFLLFEKVLPPFHRKYGDFCFYILFNFLNKISNFSQFGSNALCLASSVVFVHIKINF